MCFDNLIGVRGKCDNSTSGLYIQDLGRGLTIKNADSTINEEQRSGIELIEQKITFAIEYVKNTIANHLAGKFKQTSVIENDTVGLYHDNLKPVSGETGYLRGLQITVENYPNLEFFLGSVSLQMQAAGTATIKVYDLIQNKLLDTFTITSTADNSIAQMVVNKSYPTNRQKLNLFIGYDSTIPSRQSLLYYNLRGCNTCNPKVVYRNPYASFRGGKISTSGQYIASNIKSLGDAGGLSINYSLQCNMELFLCSMANKIAWPARYKAGAEIIAERMFSTRLNSVTMLYGKEDAALRQEFEDEFEMSMRNLLTNIKVPKDICFECNQRIKHTTQIP